MDDDDKISRADFERAIRSLNATHLHNRDALLQLAAQVVALTDEVSRRLETDTGPSVAEAVAGQLRETLAQIRINDLGGTRVALMISDTSTTADIPCAELIPLCGGRCCRFLFALSTKELDEGVIRWDYGRPYIIRQRSSDGFCTHNEPTTKGCTVHDKRPGICRSYDCRNDKRVWIDYAKRIPQPEGEPIENFDPGEPIDLYARMIAREEAVQTERVALDSTRGDEKR